MIRVDDAHVLSLYRHPKLISIETGRTEREWPELKTGDQTSSIIRESPPPVAFDPKTRRLAVADADGIRIVDVKAGGQA